VPFFLLHENSSVNITKVYAYDGLTLGVIYMGASLALLQECDVLVMQHWYLQWAYAIGDKDIHRVDMHSQYKIYLSLEFW